MKKKVLQISFFNEDGEQVHEFTRCPASADMVVASLSFLKVGWSLEVALIECEFDKDGNIIPSAV